MKRHICSAIGVVGSAFVSLIGGWDSSMNTLVLCMITDYISGLALAVVWKKSPKTETGGLNSNIGFKGIIKKCIMLWFVLIANRLDIMLGWDFVKTAVILSFVANELLSICENVGLMGVPLPPIIRRCIDVLNERGVKDEN